MKEVKLDTIELTIDEVGQLHQLMYGIPQLTKGFLAEIGPKEGMKRILGKAGREFTKSLREFYKHRDKINTDLGDELTKEIEKITRDKTLDFDTSSDIRIEELTKEKDKKFAEKLKELAEPLEKFIVQKADFSMIEDMSFADNYTYLYEMLFD